MPSPLSGPGLGLPLPQNLYPSQLNNAPSDTPTNRVALNCGDSFVIPAGDWYVSLGMYLILQFLDPITNVWTFGASGGIESGVTFVKSDGFTTRIANLTSCPVGAINTSPTTQGGWVQSSTTITVTGGGGSTWLPIVGGAIGVYGGTLAAVGAGYGVPPILYVAPPPPAANNANGVGGIPASGYCVITSGTVTAITLTNQGSGYQSAPVGVIVPSPFDPNLSSGITAASVVFSLTGTGSITGVLCTNNGASLVPNALTLTPAGVGTNATLSPVFLQTVTAVSTSGTGTGWGTVSALCTSTGGAPSAGSLTLNPDYLGIGFKVRPLQCTLALTNQGTIAAQVGTIVDGGLFESKPTPILAPGEWAGGPAIGAGSIVGPTVTFSVGGIVDIAVIQPAP